MDKHQTKYRTHEQYAERRSSTRMVWEERRRKLWKTELEMEREIRKEIKKRVG